MSLPSRLDNIIEEARKKLHEQIEQRKKQLTRNKCKHLEVCKILEFNVEEGRKIDLYQNIGRFFFRYAGSVLENSTKAVLEVQKGGKTIWISNRVSLNPKKFEIDSYVKTDNEAHEIKWRNATTDGNHVRKEHDKLNSIIKAGMIPVRIMFYMPERRQAHKIQKKLIQEYLAKGEAYIGEHAWNYIKDYTGFDLRSYLF